MSRITHFSKKNVFNTYTHTTDVSFCVSTDEGVAAESMRPDAVQKAFRFLFQHLIQFESVGIWEEVNLTVSLCLTSYLYSTFQHEAAAYWYDPYPSADYIVRQ